MSGQARILIIKHGALGDFVQALGACHAIRGHHPDARITLLTTKPLEAFARAMDRFDEIWLDPRAPAAALGPNLALRRRLIEADFTRVYDLQTSSRSSLYFRFFPRRRRPEWSGIAKGASHLQDTPGRGRMHTVDRLEDQLRIAGIPHVPLSDLSWVAQDVSRFGLPPRYGLLVPGGSAHRPEKRWPAAHYGALAKALDAKGLTPVVLGGPDEADLGTEILAGAGTGLDLIGQTSLLEIAALAKGALLAVGNDTGPMHIAAAAGAPSVVLFSDASDPARCAPRGPKVTVLQRALLADLSVEEVLASVQAASRLP